MDKPLITKETLEEIWTGFTKYRKIPKLVQRIAEGLGNREIAIVAADTFDNLKLAMLESSLFEETNITQVSPDNPEKLDGKDLILLDYAAIDSENEADVRKKLGTLMKHKDRRDGLIVYCKPPRRIPVAVPQNIPDDVPQEERDGWKQSLFALIADTPNTVVVTQYGRLLSDILVMMMTTSNPKKKG